jgi:hypothetical protein
MSRLLLAASVTLAIVLTPLAALAQAPAPAGRLRVTVVDQNGGVIPNARVVVTSQNPPAKDDGGRPRVAPPAPIVTSASGVASVESLAPGQYIVQAEFPGFDTTVVRDVRVRNGDNRRTVMLPLKKMTDEVTVGRDKQSSALDPQGASFSTVLTREQIAALPDDPDEMERVLKAMSPPGASMRVDGFTGGRLPPKSQIRSIRLPRMDMIAAQNHGGLNGMMFIDIMTQPGNGPLGGSLDFTFRDDALNARNPFTPVKGDEGLRQGGASLSGSIVPNKSSFALTVQRANQFDTTSLLAAVPGATIAQAVRRPTDRYNVTARFDQALTKDHMARFSYTRTSSDARNLGVGSYDLPERAYSSVTSDNQFRISENGAIGRRFFGESRLQVHWSDAASRSLVNQPAIRVLDAFTSGGAQQAGGRRVVDFEAASDLDYVRGRHSMRTGFLLEGGRYRSDESTNDLGTFTFASLADYQASRPATYTRRTGDPLVRYSNVQVGAYLQDDYRLAKSLLLSYGLRYEAQTLIPDQLNFSPRATLSWSPAKSGKTTIRTGVGVFSDWIGTGTYEQALRVNGVRQQEVNVSNPGYPDAGLTGTTPPTNRYQLGSGLRLPESRTMNVGVDQSISQSFRVNATYSYRRGLGLLRGRNLNLPLAGVRPDLRFANVVDVVGDAASRGHALNFGATLLLLNWHRTFFAANYAIASSETNTTGAFSLPANGDDLSTEWGPTVPRHRVGGSFSTQPIRNLGVSINVRAQSGTPYNITTGVDSNGDGVFGDRPAGVGRNTARAAAQWDLGLRLSYSIGFGTKPASSGGGQQMVMVSMGGGSVQGGFGGGAADKRYRLEFYASAQNLTNHDNLVGYSGVVTSPFFKKPTNAMNPRKAEIGLRFGF